VAIALTLKTSGTADLSTSPATANEVLGAQTFAAGSIVVVVVAGTSSGTTSANWLSCSATGLTFTAQVSPFQSGDDNAHLRILTAPDSAGGSRAITITSGSQTCFGILYAIYELTGHDTGSPYGGTATSAADTPTDGAHTLTLSAAPATSSIVLAAFYGDTDPASSGVTVGTGWSEDVDIVSGGSFYGKLQTQRRTSSTSTTVTWDDIKPDSVTIYSQASAALELKEAAGGGGGAERYGPRLVVPNAAAVQAATW
jgi:hypothetical protein